MNIFATSSCPIESALNLDDLRANKMVTETAQLLSTEAWRLGIPAPYRPTHKGHPCAVWLQDNPEAMAWLLEHGFALAEVYRMGMGRGKIHAASRVFRWFRSLIPPYGSVPSWFPNCAARSDLGISFKDLECPHQAYRLYLVARWERDHRPPVWTNRPIPDFYPPF